MGNTMGILRGYMWRMIASYLYDPPEEVPQAPKVDVPEGNRPIVGSMILDGKRVITEEYPGLPGKFIVPTEYPFSGPTRASVALKLKLEGERIQADTEKRAEKERLYKEQRAEKDRLDRERAERNRLRDNAYQRRWRRADEYAHPEKYEAKRRERQAMYQYHKQWNDQ